MTKAKEKTVSILVNNRPDVLARIAGAFSLRSFNIDSISANVTKDPSVTKIIVTASGNQETLAKIEKQINNMVDIISVNDLTKTPSVRREMLLIRVNVSDANQGRVINEVQHSKAKVVSKDDGYWVIEVTGDTDEIEGILSRFAELGMDDFTRTGTVALESLKP